jgi:hypothetical protein
MLFWDSPMKQRMTCLQGHHWEAPHPTAGEITTLTCPVCGAAGVAAQPVTSVTTAASSQAITPRKTSRGSPIFWIAIILVIGLGIASFFVVPLLFPNLVWFGASSPLRDEKTVVVRPRETQRLQWNNPLVETATVTISSPGNPVNAFVVSEPDIDAAIRTMNQGMPPAPTLASKPWVETARIEIKPGRKPFVLLLQTSARKADVSVKVEGR